MYSVNEFGLKLHTLDMLSQDEFTLHWNTRATRCQTITKFAKKVEKSDCYFSDLEKAQSRITFMKAINQSLANRIVKN